MDICVPCACHKWELYLLELDLQMVVSHCVALGIESPGPMEEKPLMLPLVASLKSASCQDICSSGSCLLQPGPVTTVPALSPCWPLLCPRLGKSAWCPGMGLGTNIPVLWAVLYVLVLAGLLPVLTGSWFFPSRLTTCYFWAVNFQSCFPVHLSNHMLERDVCFQL